MAGTAENDSLEKLARDLASYVLQGSKENRAYLRERIVRNVFANAAYLSIEYPDDSGAAARDTRM